MFFREKKKKNNERRTAVTNAPRSIPSIISAGLYVQGDLRTEGNIEIDGEVEGNIRCDTVTVRRDGVVKGNISANEIFLDGSANGMIKGKNIYVAPGATVSGVLFYDTLTVKDGAALNAQCKSLSELNEKMAGARNDNTAGAEDDGDDEGGFFEEMTLTGDDPDDGRFSRDGEFLYSEAIGDDDDEDGEYRESDMTAAEYAGDDDEEEDAPRGLNGVKPSGIVVLGGDDGEDDERVYGGDDEGSRAEAKKAAGA